MMPQMNWYVPQTDDKNLFQCQTLGNVPSRGFRFRYFWDSKGERTQDPNQGQRYFLSTMLGVTSGRGNTVAEVISYLKRAATADGKRPRGTIYFMWNNDVRSTTRHACFEIVAAQINGLGVEARVVQGTLPTAAPDIMGLMTGTSDFDFAATRSVILPGAICEHLTSAGGMLASNGGQTPLTQFLKYGAAGASGHRDRAARHSSQVSAPVVAAPLRPRLLAGRSVFSIDYRTVSNPDRRRSPVPTVGRVSAYQGRWNHAGARGEWQRHALSAGDRGHRPSRRCLRIVRGRPTGFADPAGHHAVARHDEVAGRVPRGTDRWRA